MNEPITLTSTLVENQLAPFQVTQLRQPEWIAQDDAGYKPPAEIARALADARIEQTYEIEMQRATD